MEYLIGGGTDMTVVYSDPYVLTLPEGNYTGANLASGKQDLLNGLLSHSVSRFYFILQEELPPLKQNPKGFS